MEKRRKLSVEELRSGMIFNKPIYIDNENILVDSNEPVKEADIKKLATWGVSEVETAGHLIDIINPQETKPKIFDSEEQMDRLLLRRP